MKTLEQIEQKALDPERKYPVGLCFVSQMDDSNYFQDIEYNEPILSGSEYLCTFGVFGRFYLPDSGISIVEMRFEKFDFFMRNRYVINQIRHQYYLVTRNLKEKRNDNMEPVKIFPDPHNTLHMIVGKYQDLVMSGFLKKYCRKNKLYLSRRVEKHRVYSDFVRLCGINDEEAKERWYMQPENYPG